MLLGSKEVAVALGTSERTALRLFKSGEIKAFQVGKRCGRGKLWRTRPEILQQYLRDNLGEVGPRRLASSGTEIRAIRAPA
jgi:excisionase family DNA binding protein